MFAALKPDKSLLGLFEDMAAAQVAIANHEPDVVLQGQYQIHPCKFESVVLEKFDGEYVGQAPVEVVHLL